MIKTIIEKISKLNLCILGHYWDEYIKPPLSFQPSYRVCLNCGKRQIRKRIRSLNGTTYYEWVNEDKQ